MILMLIDWFTWANRTWAASHRLPSLLSSVEPSIYFNQFIFNRLISIDLFQSIYFNQFSWMNTWSTAEAMLIHDGGKICKNKSNQSGWSVGHRFCHIPVFLQPKHTLDSNQQQRSMLKTKKRTNLGNLFGIVHNGRILFDFVEKSSADGTYLTWLVDLSHQGILFHSFTLVTRLQYTTDSDVITLARHTSFLELWTSRGMITGNDRNLPGQQR